MLERIAVISAREAIMAPAQLCALEFEEVLGVMLGATIVPVFAPSIGQETGMRRFDRLIFVAMNYWQLSRMIAASADLRRHVGSSQAFVFDSFHRYLARWTSRFPQPLQPAARLFRHELRNLVKLTDIFAPTALTIDEQQAFIGVPIHHLPIGVDAVRFGSSRQDRTIDVNAYGRQPPPLSNYLADRLNVRDGRYRYSHTDHLASITIADPRRHRALFWRMLADSRVAIAYAPESHDPLNRFDCSFVGQRWYEAIAAGCVVMGERPSAPETAQLFDWPDALIDLPGEPACAWDVISALIDEPQRLARISRRNAGEALARHDWRHRIATMADTLHIEPDARFAAELAKASSPGNA